MIQAEVGGAARVDPGNGIQRPGFLIRDLTLPASDGRAVQISRFRGNSNLVVAFTVSPDSTRAFLEDVVRHSRGFSAQEATVIVVVPYGPDEGPSPIAGDSPIVMLYDRTLTAFRLSGAADEGGRPMPVVYVTDRFGEILSAYCSRSQSISWDVQKILNTLEFMNQQCPECEPPEWPR